MTSWYMSHFHHTLLKLDMNCFKPTDITHGLGLSQGSCTAALWVFCFQSGTITCENLQYNRMPHQLFNMKLQYSHRRQGYRIGRVPALETSRNRSKSPLHLLLTLGETESVCVCVCTRVCARSITQSCLTLWDPLDCSPPKCSVHGTLQAGIWECVAMPSSRGSSRPRDWTCVSFIFRIGRQIIYHCATWEAL